jgi:hypothetical protein
MIGIWPGMGMAVSAVCCEPLSTADSLFAANLQGKDAF